MKQHYECVEKSEVKQTGQGGTESGTLGRQRATGLF